MNPFNEIGGYLGAEPYTGCHGEYYPDAVALNTARNALVYAVRARGIRRLRIPAYLCDSVSLVCDREHIPYEYYHTGADLRPVIDRPPEPDEYLYVVNLYGQLSNEELAALRDRYDRVIVDNIHAFYQPPIKGADTIRSCRKFFGVPDGAYLVTDTLLPDDLPTDVSDGRTSHIYGRLRDGATAHYAEFRANDDAFEQLPLMRMSELTHRMLSVIDYERVKRIREENFACLHRLLGSRNGLKLRMPEGPYAYPFLCENGPRVRKYLASRKIYVATLWPNVPEIGNDTERYCAENILPLPCDQRYGAEEMQIIAEELEYVRKS